MSEPRPYQDELCTQISQGQESSADDLIDKPNYTRKCECERKSNDK